MSEDRDLKPYAALFFAGYAASRGLFAAAHALIGSGCGCASHALFVMAWTCFSAGLLGLTAVASLALIRSRRIHCEICPSVMMLIPLGIVFWFSIPWVFETRDVWPTHFSASFGRYAPYASGAAAILCVLSYFKARRLGGLPPARVIR
jgi:hypothetical protein